MGIFCYCWGFLDDPECEQLHSEYQEQETRAKRITYTIITTNWIAFIAFTLTCQIYFKLKTGMENFVKFLVTRSQIFHNRVTS